MIQLKGEYKGSIKHGDDDKLFISNDKPINCFKCNRQLLKGSDVFVCPNFYVICYDCEHEHHVTCPHILTHRFPEHQHDKCILVYDEDHNNIPKDNTIQNKRRVLINSLILRGITMKVF